MKERATMEVTASTVDDILILELNGNLSAFNIDTVESRCESYMNEVLRAVVFDLTGVEHIGSAGFLLFHRFNNRCKQNNRQAVICCANEHLRHLFEVTQFQKILPIVTTRAEALELSRQPFNNPPAPSES